MPSRKDKTGVYTSPLDIPYIKTLIFSLNTIGSWPHKEMGGKKWFTDYRNTKILFAMETFIVLLGISYLIKNFKVISFIEMGRNITGIIMCLVSIQRLTISWTKVYKSVTKDFIHKIHLLHHKNQHDFAMKVFTDVEKLSFLVSKLIHWELYSGFTLFNLIPLFNNYHKGAFDSAKLSNVSYEHACYYDLPFDYITNFNGYLIVSVFNWFISFEVSSCFCLFDLYIFIMVFHLWGHLKILNHNLRSLPKPIDKRRSWYNTEESVKIKLLLVDSMGHYRLIKDFMDDLSTGFGVTICVFYMYHQIMGCIYLIETSQMSVEAFGTYGVLLVNSFQQLIQMSVVFELIGTQSEVIKDALYEVPWECMDTSNRKIVLIYLCNVQEPMNFKAMGMLPVGVRTMASVLKTTMSYFMLLRTITAVQK